VHVESNVGRSVDLRRVYALFAIALACSVCLNVILYLHFSSEIRRLKADIDENRQLITAVRMEYLQFAERTEKTLQLLEEQVGVLETTVTAELNSLKGTVEEVKTAAEEAQEGLDQVRGQLQTVNLNVSKLASNVQTLKGDVSKLKSDLSSTWAEIATVKGDVQNVQSSVSSLWLEVRSVKSDISKIWLNISSVWRELAKEAGYWSSLDELKTWLKENKVNENQYIPGVYDCDDYAIDLARAALREEKKLMFPIPVYYGQVYFYFDYALVPSSVTGKIEFPEGYQYWIVANHMADLTYCADVGWVVVEPQTDGIAILGTYEL